MSGKVEGLVAKWRKDAEGRDDDGIYWQGHSQRMHMLHAAEQLEAAIAEDAQSVAAGGEVRGTNAWRYAQLCRLIDEGDSRLDAIIGDAYNMGAGALDLFLDELHVPAGHFLATQNGDNT